MEKLSTQSKWQPWKGVIFQVIVLVLLIFPISFIQYFLGMWGVVISELMFLAIAIICALLKKTPLKEVFPIHKPTFRDIAGTIVLWLGVFPLSLVTVAVMIMLVPDLAGDTVEGMNELFTSETVIMTIITVAVLPPFCEEALQRGAALSFFRSLKHDWVIVLIMGIFFGIFHLDPVRFGATAILGAALSYLMVKRNNMVLPMILHFINNAFAVGVTLLPSSSSSDSVDYSDLGDMGFALVGLYLIIACLCPMLIAIAIHLLNPGKKLHNFRRYIIAGLLCGVMFFSGICMYMATVFNSPEFQEIYESVQAEQMSQSEDQ